MRIGITKDQIMDLLYEIKAKDTSRDMIKISKMVEILNNHNAIKNGYKKIQQTQLQKIYSDLIKLKNE